jgi:uncharacterized protein
MGGKLVHFEVPANDTARAVSFYRGLFGWEFEAYEGGPIEYHMTRVTETTGGAIHPAAEGGGIPGIFVYFDVENIHDGARQVRDLGGTAEEPGAVPGMGWYAMCADTEGNRFGLWQTDPSAEAPPP